MSVGPAREERWNGGREGKEDLFVGGWGLRKHKQKQRETERVCLLNMYVWFPFPASVREFVECPPLTCCHFLQVPDEEMNDIDTIR